jgi:PilZ domain-containing protein
VHGKEPGYLLNLSCHGAMIQASFLPAQDAFVVLKCGPLDALGTVAWMDRGCFGIKFDEPVAEDLVIALRRIADSAVGVRAWQPSGRPGLAARSLTAQEWELAERWAVDNWL